ncbi:MAG: hypothetical protein QOH61_400 [Chloroflexota bacterium]|jgi:hypothetical protein|nr:hypothetical protein [Chloroflexota bacterium]
MSEPRTPARRRSWLEVRWRQARNPPPPVLRAVLANVTVAAVGGAVVLAYEAFLRHGIELPGGDLRAVVVALYVVAVIVAGSWLTYLWVELPTGAGSERRRSGWAALLGFFASIPIVYLSLVVMFQVLDPLLG